MDHHTLYIILILSIGVILFTIIEISVLYYKKYNYNRLINKFLKLPLKDRLLCYKSLYNKLNKSK